MDEEKNGSKKRLCCVLAIPPEIDAVAEIYSLTCRIQTSWIQSPHEVEQNLKTAIFLSLGLQRKRPAQ